MNPKIDFIKQFYFNRVSKQSRKIHFCFQHEMYLLNFWLKISKTLYTSMNTISWQSKVIVLINNMQSVKKENNSEQKHQKGLKVGQLEMGSLQRAHL